GSMRGVTGGVWVSIRSGAGGGLSRVPSRSRWVGHIMRTTAATIAIIATMITTIGQLRQVPDGTVAARAVGRGGSTGCGMSWGGGTACAVGAWIWPLLGAV